MTQDTLGNSSAASNKAGSDDRHKTEELTGSKAGGTDMSEDGTGEDDGGAPIEGDDSNVKEDQKPTTQ